MTNNPKKAEPIVRIYFGADGHIRNIETTQPITVIVEYDSRPNSIEAARQRYAVSKLEPTNSDVGETAKYIAQIQTSPNGEQSFTHEEVVWIFKRDVGQWQAYYNNKPLPTKTHDNLFPSRYYLEQAATLAQFLKEHTEQK